MRFIVFFVFAFSFYSFGFAKIDFPYTEKTLKNGLKVIIITKPSPVSAVQIFYRAGGIYEQENVLGISHFLEHMLFKTTKNLKPGEYSRIIKNLGGYDNAYTTYDYTSYYNLLPAEKLEEGLRLEAERMQNLTILEQELESERNVIIEERHNRYENSPYGFLWEKANEIFFKNHLYGRPVIGYEHTIKNIDSQTLKSYYQQFYHPKNAILVVVSPLSSSKTLALVTKYFQFTPEKPFIPVSLTQKPAEPDFQTYTFKKPGKTRLVSAYLPIPATDEKITPALMVLDNILFHGQKSVLNSIVLEKNMAYSLNGGCYFRRFDSIWMVIFVPAPSISYSSILEAIRWEIENLKNRKDLKYLLEKAKKTLLTEFYKDLETAKGLANSIGWGAILKHPRFFLEIYKKASQVSEKQLLQAIDILLKYPFTIFILEPE